MHAYDQETNILGEAHLPKGSPKPPRVYREQSLNVGGATAQAPDVPQLQLSDLRQQQLARYVCVNIIINFPEVVSVCARHQQTPASC